MNGLSLVKYYNKKGKDISNQLDQLQRVYKDFISDDCNLESIENLMLIEAKYKQIYYSCFSKITSNTFFEFTQRTFKPPKDAINALMSYGYSILYSLLSNIIHRSRLHISLPVIHGNTRSTEGLQYDIADIFKPVLIDRLIFRLINKKQIDETFFNITSEYVYLNKEGARIFIEELEQTLSKTIFIEDSNRYLPYRNILSLEVHKISNHIFDKKTYKGFKMKW